LEYFIKQMLNGLAMGSIYALVAMGYNMVYGILELINFAHGDIYMFGTFIALGLLWDGVPFPLALPAACLLSGLIGAAIERIAYRPVRNAPRVVPMISAVGAALILRNLAQLIWGTMTFAFPTVLPTRTLMVAGFRINTLHLIVSGLALALMSAFALLVQRTKIGKAMRAVSQDIPVASLMGIPVNRIIQLVYFAGGVLGVVGGVLFSMYYAVWIGMGFLGTMKAWISSVIGGIGSLHGAFVGGMLLGVSEALIAGYISSDYKDAISYGLVMALLVLRPAGIFGRQVAEKV
jgi:branched-chain amino acid transport system permease protein